MLFFSFLFFGRFLPFDVFTWRPLSQLPLFRVNVGKTALMLDIDTFGQNSGNVKC